MIHAGEQVALSWKATGADYFIIDPGALKLSNQIQSTLVTPDHDTDYQIRAFSPDGRLQSTPRTLKVTVVSRDTAISKIVEFTAPETVYIGDKVRLRWVCKRARGVRIDSDKGDIIGSGLTESGFMDVVAGDRTTFTLTAADNLGKAVTKQITIDPKPRPGPNSLPDPGADRSRNHARAARDDAQPAQRRRKSCAGNETIVEIRSSGFSRRRNALRDEVRHRFCHFQLAASIWNPEVTSWYCAASARRQS